MASVGMSSLMTSLNGVAYSSSTRASLQHSITARSTNNLDSSQKLKSDLRPIHGSDILKLPFTTHHSHNYRRVKCHKMQTKCSSSETNHDADPRPSKSGSPSIRLINRRATMVASFGALAFGSCSSCEAVLAAEDWSYGGPSGPPTWTGTCATGAKQSPIDVNMRKITLGQATLGELVFDYKPSTPTFTNPGHGTMEVDFPEGINKLRLKGRELNLVQFHFHTPSEHAYDGLRFPMEAHLVHQDAASKAFAVVGIMLDATPKAKPNEALAAALQYSPLKKGKPPLTVPKDLRVTPASLLPSATQNNIRRYVHYSGSLTTPPCQESVDWILLETPLTVSTNEVVEFLKFVGNDQTLALNARPIQPVNGRPISQGP
ncbi:hypothetical protein M758_11G087600 [Ceratodon purpureus]|nr:hypothetical protein M758_11G087600 [Ceratodon purpureus]